MRSSAIDEIRNLLNSGSKNVVITTHQSPDGDAIGSSLALSMFLKKSGHQTQVITPDDYPEFLHWMPENDTVLQYIHYKKKCNEIVEKSDVIFCLDFNSIDRLAELATPVSKSQATKIVIDHHRNPQHFEDAIYHDIEASSTCELVYDFIEELNGLSLVDEKIGSAIYAGLVTDTGSFKFPSTSSRTHRIVADLIDRGVEVSAIQNNIYDTSSEYRLRLLGYALTSKMEILHEINTAIISLSEAELKNFNFKPGDTEGLVNYPLSIRTVRISVMITEKKGVVKLSFRSKGAFHVNEIAERHFNGGGHANAAGGVSDLSIEETVERVKTVMKDAILQRS